MIRTLYIYIYIDFPPPTSGLPTAYITVDCKETWPQPTSAPISWYLDETGLFRNRVIFHDPPSAEVALADMLDKTRHFKS